jgi:hypothetical protein
VSARPMKLAALVWRIDVPIRICRESFIGTSNAKPH